MAETQDLPEEIVLNIFSRLPVKSLIRFSSVSKRMHFTIFSDPKFARSQFKAARLSRRLLVSTDVSRVESLQLDDTPSFGDPSSVRKLTLPFPQQPREYVKLLGSCNGLVFVSVDDEFYYVWNPTLRFFNKLPPPGFVSREINFSRKLLLYYLGAGYLSSIDDSRVFVGFYDLREGDLKVELFSLRTRTWERIKSPAHFDVKYHNVGTFSNDALHWLNPPNEDERDSILCFDLAVKEFRTMPLPDVDNVDGKSFCNLGVCDGCLCVTRYPEGVYESVDFWGMRKYGVSDSWTMLFSFKLSDPPQWGDYCRKLMVVGSTVALDRTAEGFKLVKVDHKEDQKVGQYTFKGSWIWICMVEYEESLLWINGYHPVEETEHVASQS